MKCCELKARLAGKGVINRSPYTNDERGQLLRGFERMGSLTGSAMATSFFFVLLVTLADALTRFDKLIRIFFLAGVSYPKSMDRRRGSLDSSSLWSIQG